MFIFYVLNDDIVDIDKSDGISSPIFVVDKFPEFLLHPSIFAITRFKIFINNKWCFIRFLVLNKV